MNRVVLTFLFKGHALNMGAAETTCSPTSVVVLGLKFPNTACARSSLDKIMLSQKHADHNQQQLDVNYTSSFVPFVKLQVQALLES